MNFSREGPPLPNPLPHSVAEREKIIVGRRTQGVALGYHLPPFQGFGHLRLICEMVCNIEQGSITLTGWPG